MRGDALPSAPDAAAAARWHATLALAFDGSERGTRLAMRDHRGPLVVQRALYPEGADVCHAIVVHPPGGIAGGDELTIEIGATRGAHAVLTTPGAAKMYKSAGRRAAQRVTLRAAARSTLEWLPQETLVFDAAEGTLALSVEVDSGSLAIAWEVITLGREAMGERFARGVLDTVLEVRIDARPVLIERGRVEGGSAWLDSPVGWAGARTSATFVAAGRAIDDELLEACRDTIGPWTPRAGVSRLAPSCLVGRYLGSTPAEARAAFGALWALLRPRLTGRAASPLRIWAT